MSDIILSQILSGYNLAEVNRNFQIIQDTLNKLMLRKDGENAILSGNLDVNGQALLNVGDLEINGISVLDGVNQIESAYSRIVEELEDYSYKLQDIINKSIEAGAVDRNHTNNVQATWTLSSVVSVGSTLTLPYHYTVGKNTLHLSYNNFYRMYKGIDYDEVGDIGEQSNQIVVKRTAIPTGARMEMWVEAGSEMMQILEAVIEAKETLETYNVDLINSFITAVSDAQNAQLETTLTNATNAANDLASQTSNANTLRAEIQSMIDSINRQSEVISFYYNSLNSLYEGLLAIQNSNIDLSRLQESVEGLVEAASTITISLDSAIEAAEVATEAKELAVDSKNLSVDAKNTAVSSANSARIWAEGEDVEVAGQGGEHSSKEWALIASDAKELAEEYKNDASASANEAATSSELAGTYAQNAHDDYIAIQSVADSLEDAVEGAKQIVDQAEEIGEGALLKSGGQMSGDIYKSTNDTRLVVGGGTDSGDGAYVRLSGLNETGKEGQFVIHADGDNNYCELVGKADKTLKWGNDDVLTSASTLDASKLNVSYLPTAGGTMTGNITGVGASFTSLTVNGRDVTKLGGSKVLGEIVQSAIPLTDAGLHLLDGTKLMSGGAYDAFVQHINGLQATYPSLFCTQAEFDLSVANYGVCSKFVASSSGVRLPKLYSETRYLVKAWKSSSGDKWYNLYSDGWCEQGGTARVSAVTNNVRVDFQVEMSTADYALSINYGGSNSYSSSTGTPDANQVVAWTAITNRADTNGFYINRCSSSINYRWSISGYALEVPDQEKIYRYICVATAVKEPTEVVIDNIITDNNNKADKDFANVTKPYIVEMGENSAGWWIIYSNGWVEQGGKTASINKTETGTTVPLNIEMASSDYDIFMQRLSDGASSAATAKVIKESVTQTSFRYVISYASAGTSAYSTIGGESNWKIEGWKK